MQLLAIDRFDTLGIIYLDDVYVCRSFARKETNVKVKLGNDVQILFSYATGARWINNAVGVMCTARHCYELRFTYPRAFLANQRWYDRTRVTQSVSLLIDTPLTHSFDRARCDSRWRSVAAMHTPIVHLPLSSARNIVCVCECIKKEILFSQQNTVTTFCKILFAYTETTICR